MTPDNPAHWALFDDVWYFPPDPAPGIFAILTPPPDRDYEVVAVTCDFTAALGVSNRYLQVRTSTIYPDTIIGTTIAPITAGQTWQAQFGIGLNNAATALPRYMTAPLIQRLRLPANTVLVLPIINVQAGDQLSNIGVHVNMQVKSPV